jgi:hypothetical protein
MVALVGVLPLANAPIAGAAPGDPSQEVLPGTASVVICHATGNSFTRNEVNVSSIVNKEGHGGHANDIIPPFRYQLSPAEDVRHYPGKNWDEQGEAIWTNGCSRPPPPTGEIEVFACVDVHDGGFDAKFGYNSSAGEVVIPAGPANGFSPGPVARGQVTEFSGGYVLAAFTVEHITEPELTWTVVHNGRSDSVTVNRSSAPCSIPPEPPPEPESVVPIGVFVTCVVNHGSTFDAVFGYRSRNRDPQTIPVGPANRFSPAPADRGQPTTFSTGRFEEAVKVTGIPSSVALSWTLALTDTRMAIATADFEVKCNRPEPEPSPRAFGIFATCVTRHGSTYDATFGYVNEGTVPLRVPTGARNSVEPGPDAQGQPEIFAPGFVDAAFVVQGVPRDRSVTWRVKPDDDEVRVAVATADLPACLTDELVPVSQVEIDKEIVPSRAVVGQRVTSTIVLRNTGSEILRPIEAKDVMRGARQKILSARTTQGECRAGFQALRCRTLSLPPGESLTIRLVARATETGVARDEATIVGVPDSSPGDNVATAGVRVASPPGDLGLG